MIYLEGKNQLKQKKEPAVWSSVLCKYSPVFVEIFILSRKVINLCNILWKMCLFWKNFTHFIYTMMIYFFIFIGLWKRLIKIDYFFSVVKIDFQYGTTWKKVSTPSELDA